MAHSTSDHLHRLIRSMSRSEKRFFKIHLRTHSSKHLDSYELLFDRISDQEVYKEVSLIKEFKTHGQRFPVMKHRLYEKVLDALEVFSRGNDPVLELRTSMNKAQVLLNRGLFSQSISILDTIMQKATELDLWDIVLEAKRLLLNYMGPDLSNAERPEWNLALCSEEMNTIFDQLKEEWHLTYERAVIFRRLEVGIRNTESGHSDHTVLGEWREDMRPKSKFLWHHAKAAEAFRHNQANETLEHTHQCIELLEHHDHLTRDHKLSLAKMLANGFYSSYRSHDLEQAEVFMVRLKTMFKEERDSAAFPEYLALYLQCKLFIENYAHTYYDAEHIQDMETLFETGRESLDKKVRSGLDYGFALFHHGISDNGAALRALNRILNAGDISRDDEVYARALIFSNVLHIEADDREWLMHSARTLKRYLNSRGRLGATEAALLKYIGDIRRSRTKEGEAKALDKYMETLRSIRRMPMERISFEYFDFLRWAEQRAIHPSKGYGMVA